MHKMEAPVPQDKTCINRTSTYDPLENKRLPHATPLAKLQDLNILNEK